MANENESLMNLLCQVPDLVEANNELTKNIQRLIISFGEATKQRLEATIPDTEIMKITDRVVSSVENTSCQVPDMNAVAESLANEISEGIADKVKEKVTGTEIEIKHKHEHYSISNLWSIVDEKSKEWIKILCWIIAVLVLAIGILAKAYYGSEVYWGRRYARIYFSEQTTDEERKELRMDTKTVSFIPIEFGTSPRKIKARIRRRELLLEDRKNNNY